MSDPGNWGEWSPNAHADWLPDDKQEESKMIDLHLTVEEAEDMKSAIMTRILHTQNSIWRAPKEWTAYIKYREEELKRAYNIFLLLNEKLTSDDS